MKSCLITENFTTIISDFYSDLSTTFPEIKNKLTSVDHELSHIKSLEQKDLSTLNELDTIPNLKGLFEFCKNIYPERFFDLLYQNEDIFTNDEINTEFLPDIDFKILWKQDISDNTKTILWKYLQLICFSIIKNEKDGESFGETAALFEAIDETELKNKLKETMEQMSNIFNDTEKNDTNGGAENNTSDNNGGDSNTKTNMEDLFGDLSNNIPDPDKLHEHIHGLLGGKLGRLASEITEESFGDLTDISGINSMDDIFKKFFKDPSKILNIIKKIGGNLDKKIKSGEIKESEIMEEASELMNKLDNIPGLKNMKKMMTEMGLDMGNNKINLGATKQKLKHTMQNMKTKERMKKKLESRKKETTDDQIASLEKQLAEAKAENTKNKILEELDNDDKVKKNKKRRNRKKR
jgi:hypothetical protein